MYMNYSKTSCTAIRGLDVEFYVTGQIRGRLNGGKCLAGFSFTGFYFSSLFKY